MLYHFTSLALRALLGESALHNSVWRLEFQEKQAFLPDSTRTPPGMPSLRPGRTGARKVASHAAIQPALSDHAAFRQAVPSWRFRVRA